MALDAIDGPEVTIEYLEVPESAVTNLESYSEVAADDYVSLVGSFELTYGTLVWADNDYVAACLVPGKTSSPLNTVSLLFLSTGANPEVLSAAIGTSEHFEIFDARCSENGVVWTECNVLENHWRVYTAQLSGADLGEATLVDEGDSNWLTPSIAAVEIPLFGRLLRKPRVKTAKTILYSKQHDLALRNPLLFIPQNAYLQHAFAPLPMG